jgi:hypothetical protein
MQAFVEKLQVGSHLFTSRRLNLGTNPQEENRNWFFAIGSYVSWGKGAAKVTRRGARWMKPRALRTASRLRSWVNAGVLVATLFGWACKDKGNGEMSTIDATAESLDRVSKDLGLSFPPSARLVGAERMNGNDTLRFKVEMAATDLATFLARAPVPSEAFEPGSGGYLGRDHGFWDPATAQKLRTAQTFVGARALSIGVAEGNGRSAILYIVNQGM